jgi:hypothetical protein
MVHDLDEPDEFALICHEFGMAWCNLVAEERHDPFVLVEE